VVPLVYGDMHDLAQRLVKFRRKPPASIPQNKAIDLAAS
jgi:hypothetical protein